MENNKNNLQNLGSTSNSKRKNESSLKFNYLSNLESKRNPFWGSKNKVVILGFLFIFFIIGLFLSLQNYESKKEIVALEGLQPLSYKDAVNSGLEPAANTKVIALSMSVDINDINSLKIADLKNYDNGVLVLNNLVDETSDYDYSIEISNQDGIVFNVFFNAPLNIIHESIDPVTNEIKAEQGSSITTIPLTIPWFGDNAILLIKDKSGKVLEERSLDNIEKVNNNPEYTIWR